MVPTLPPRTWPRSGAWRVAYRGRVDLSGTWRAAVADEALRRTFAQPDADDSAWDELPVPGEWSADEGARLYRHHFEAPAPEHGRAWLVFDGIWQQGDVWLDGAYLGDTDGAFARHTFEVTEQLRTAQEHLVAVDVAGDGERGGIWRDVRIEHTGPVRARSLRILCREATEERAVVALRAELDSDVARTVDVRTVIAGQRHESQHPVAAGSNFVEWTVTVPQPERWWPHSLGAQPMHHVVVEVVVDGSTSHTLRRRVGLRSVQMRNGVMTINGERLFVKGICGLNVALARDAGFDLVRLTDIAPEQLYDDADRLGVLLWQDFRPPGTRKQAGRQANAAVDLLGHHPSLVIWSPGRAVRRAIDKADSTRPVLASRWPHVDDPVPLARAIPRFVRFVERLTPQDDARARIEALRRIKYRPTGGFCLDGDVGLDVVDACRPVIVVTDALPDSASPGDALALDVHVVSDLRSPLESARVDAVLAWEGGSHDWHWEGDIPADGCALVGTVQAVVPDAPGPLRLELTLHAGEHVATNAVTTMIA
jgi:hypothetical protein